MISSFKEKKLDYAFRSKNEEPEKDTSYSRLYLDFYNLEKPPFTITPDPEFMYSSSTHKTAIENILYGIESCMGFILLTGEVGTGKTTLCRAILDELEDRAETVYIINPSLSGIEIIQAVLDDLGLDCQAGSSKKSMLDRLNRFLLDVTKEKPVVIIIDDAQTMTPDGLENLRLLSNLETDKRKLLQLVLAGQQELLGLLSRPELRQLKQRITICCHLDLIGRAELRQYIALRLFVAGDNGRVRFTEAAIKEIHKASGGIPRLINVICDYALTAGYISDSTVIEKEHARRAINELSHQSLVQKTFLSKNFSYITENGVRLGLLTLLVVILLSVFFYGKVFNKNPQSMAEQQESEALHVTHSNDFTPGNSAVSADIIPVKNNREYSSVIENKLTAPGDNKKSIAEAPENYIVQISSLKTLQAAVQEGMFLRQKGLDAHWNAVHLIKKGTWYRVYQGGFSTKKEAMAFMEETGIAKGIIIYAPWTIIITSRDKAKTPENIYLLLQEKGLDCILEKDGKRGYRLTSGAFRSFERAQKAALEMVEMDLDAEPLFRRL